MYKVLAALLAHILLSSLSFAQSSFVSKKKIGGRPALERLVPDSVSYFSIFTGPSIGNGVDPVDEFGAIQEGGVSTWAQVSARYKINDRVSFVANPRFVMNHNVDPDQGKEYEWDNPVFGINGLWYKNGKFSVGGGLTSIVPALRTESTKERGLLFNPGGFNSANYAFNSQWKAGLWFNGRYFIYDRSLTDEDERYSFFAAPTLNYSWNDSVQAGAFYRYNANGDESGNLSFERDDSLNILLSWSLNRMLTLQPILSVFRESDYDFSDANFSMWLSGRIF